MKRLLRSEVLWLALGAVVVFVAIERAGLLCTTARPDTPSYEAAFEQQSLTTSLAWHRALGYPAFLAVVRSVAGGLDRLPHVQLALFLATVPIFAACLRRFSGSSLAALLAALPLLAAPLAWRFAPKALSDVPAAALGVLTVSWLMLCIVRPQRWLPWAALALTLFVTYQFRPAYLFLIGAVPLVGLLWTLRRAGWRLPRPVLLRRSALLLAVAALPFLLWSALRGVAVGHFGAVSFGGMNIVGIAGSMLGEQESAALPADLQPLAQEILRLRRDRKVEISSRYDFQRWAQQFNLNVWQTAIPAARAVLDRDHVPAETAMVEANRLLTRLSWGLIRQRPDDYLRWMRDGVLHSIVFLGRQTLFAGGLVLVALGLVLAAWRRVRGSNAVAPVGGEATALSAAAIDLSLLAAVYLLLSLGLVVVVEYPLDRYVLACGLFVPSALFVAGAALLLAPNAPEPAAT